MAEADPGALEAGPAGVPYGFARRHRVIIVGDPVTGAAEALHCGPLTLATLGEVQRVCGTGLRWRPIAGDEFEAALAAHYRDSATEAADFAAQVGGGLAALADSAAAVDDLLDQRDDSPVIRLINALLLEAVKEGASDIHVEVMERRLVVRFRVDGVLRDIVEPQRNLAPLLVSRIKIMARLDIAEKRVPHDGRVTLRVGGQDIDVRVSTLPTQHGERVVMRLLGRDTVRLDVGELGMKTADRVKFERMLGRPHGMVLVTGPTGSGKTTTLYAALNHLNDRRRNIMTVEDPIEYALEGIGQTQVNPRADMTFGRGLRAILRQDPDVIMVGEVRDRETAEVAVRSAMTGHFVLTTLHTNSAIGSVTRLIDMGVERYLLAPMLVGLIAQRLVRRLCATCRREDIAGPRDVLQLGRDIAEGARLWRPEGCSACHGEGYRGRTAIYELVEIDETLQALIHDGAPEAALVRVARERAPALLIDGVAKILAGETTVEEVARVVREAE